MSLREKILGATFGVMGLTSVAAAEAPTAPEGGTSGTPTTQPRKLTPEEQEAERKQRNEAMAKEREARKARVEALKAGLAAPPPPIEGVAPAAPEETARKLAEQQAVLDKYEEDRKKNPNAVRPGLSGPPIKQNPGVAEEKVAGYDHTQNINPVTGKPINPTSEKADEWVWNLLYAGIGAVGLGWGAFKGPNFLARRREKKELEALRNKKPPEAGQGGTAAAADDPQVRDMNRKTAENNLKVSELNLEMTQKKYAEVMGGETPTVDVDPSTAFRGGNAAAVEDALDAVADSAPAAKSPSKQAENMFPSPAAGNASVPTDPPPPPSALRKPHAPKPD